MSTEAKCELNYYGILNVPRDATKDEITLSYRKLAISCNPHRDSDYSDCIPCSWLGDTAHLEGIEKEKQWAYINMAYDVLSHSLRREIYDRFGEAGLFQGIPLPNGYFPPYMYHGDHFKVYYSVFGSYSPFANIIDIATNPTPLYSTKNGIGIKVKDPPVVKTIYLELKDVFYGTMKRMKILRQEYIDDLKTITDIREKILLLKIPPGTLAGSKFTFPNEGDRSPTTISSDIIFITADKPHDIFERQVNDLIYVHPVSLCEALVGFRFAIQTIDDRKICVLITDIVNQNYEKIIPNEGLPKIAVEGQDFEKGNLIIRFKVLFPQVVPRHLKCNLKQLFDQIEAENNQVLTKFYGK